MRLLFSSWMMASLIFVSPAKAQESWICKYTSQEPTEPTRVAKFVVLNKNILKRTIDGEYSSKGTLFKIVENSELGLFAVKNSTISNPLGKPTAMAVISVLIGKKSGIFRLFGSNVNEQYEDVYRGTCTAEQRRQ